MDNFTNATYEPSEIDLRIGDMSLNSTTSNNGLLLPVKPLTFDVPFDSGDLRDKWQSHLDNHLHETINLSRFTELVLKRRDANIDQLDNISDTIVSTKQAIKESDAKILISSSHQENVNKKLINERNNLLNERESILLQIESITNEQKQKVDEEDRNMEKRLKIKNKSYIKNISAYELYTQLKIEKDEANSYIKFIFCDKFEITVLLLDNLQHSVKSCTPWIDYKPSLDKLNCGVGDGSEMRDFIISIRKLFLQLP